jgi:hypothetical protein
LRFLIADFDSKIEKGTLCFRDFSFGFSTLDTLDEVPEPVEGLTLDTLGTSSYARSNL